MRFAGLLLFSLFSLGYAADKAALVQSFSTLLYQPVTLKESSRPLPRNIFVISPDGYALGGEVENPEEDFLIFSSQSSQPLWLRAIGAVGDAGLMLYRIKNRFALDYRMPSAYTAPLRVGQEVLVIALVNGDPVLKQTFLSQNNGSTWELNDAKAGYPGSLVCDTSGAMIGMVVEGKTIQPFSKEFMQKNEGRLHDDKVIRAYLGMTVSRLSAGLYGYYGQQTGALITHTDTNGTAERAGLQRGDLVVEVGGVAVRSVADLAKAIDTRSQEGNTTIGFIRRGLHKEASVPFASVDRNILNPNAYEYEGMIIENLSDEIRMVTKIPDVVHGIYVGVVLPGSKAEKSGLKSGDVIIRYNAEDVESLHDLRKLVIPEKKGTLTIYRSGWNMIKKL